MATLQELIREIKDPALRKAIAEAVEELTQSKQFGLVFEEHLPDYTPLYGVPIKEGSLVAQKFVVQPKTKKKKRGEEAKAANHIYAVLQINGDDALCEYVNDEGEKDQEIFSLKKLVAVARFNEPIYPYLHTIASVCNAPKSDLWHTLIEADNYHALQLLEYLYAGKVDCIYIDPPYNTGASTWKYNNNYVDENDSYRHSKWLSMMEKRLKLAKKLLSPNGVLIVAIDEHELNTLGLLLQERELFPEYELFCITVVQNPNGNQGKNFGRTNEFAYFLIPTKQQLLSLEDRTDEPDIRPLRDVSGNSNMRTDAENCFYPIYTKDGAIVGFGDVCDDAFHPGSANIVKEDGTIEIYPIDAKGNERKWVFARQSVESILDQLHIEWNASRKIYDVIRYKTDFTYKTVWGKKAYNANSYGSKLINGILGEERFDYPKSLYTVYECVKSVCKGKKDALVLDFFAGSGTTLHAVNLLNAEDGGHRRCIMVTNNEVSEENADEQAGKGYLPGDPEWESLGIARYVTWPRTVCSIKGQSITGQPLNGTYGVAEETYEEIPKDDFQLVSAKTGKLLKTTVYKKGKRQVYPGLEKINKSGGFEANAIYFKLGFLDKTSVALGKQFAALLSILWMKAGAVGKCPSLSSTTLPSMLIYPENHFAVLLKESAYSEFVPKLTKHPEIQTIYFVTDSTIAYEAMAGRFREAHKKPYQLYKNYLENFKINIEKTSWK